MLNALKGEKYGTIEKPINDSKGCGGVMRVAPIGLYFDNEKNDQKEIDMLGARVASIDPWPRIRLHTSNDSNPHNK